MLYQLASCTAPEQTRAERPTTILKSSNAHHPSPTRMNLTLTKGRLKGAQTGHSLLAKKRDALTTRFRQILKKVDEVGHLEETLRERGGWELIILQAKRLMGRVLQLASFSLAEVTYAAGDIGYQVQESVKKASYTVQAKQENVSGVVLPAFEGVKSKDTSGQ